VSEGFLARVAEYARSAVTSAGATDRDDHADYPADTVSDRAAGPAGASDPAGTAVDVDGVSVRLGDETVLRDVDATVDRGAFVGLVGPNGAGKTTLLRTIAGVLTPASGTVRIDGDDVHALPSRAASRRVAVVPQDTSLAFDFDVREVVAMGRTPHRSRFGGGDAAGREAVDRALERTAVDHLAGRPVSDVSGGERQRVLLARALAQDAPVLLLDEPTASLDINHQVRTLELVRELVREGKTAVAAIHDLNLAAHYCDELLLLGDGRALAAGAPTDVLTEDRLATAFGTRAAVARHPVTGSVYVTALPETAAGGERGLVHVVGGGGTAARLLYLLSAAGFEVSTGALNEGDADLETARLLGIEAVTVEPFSPVSDRAAERVERLVTDADVTVVADVEVGDGNLPNLRAARAADSLVLVEERPFAERNYAGERARRAYDDLLARGTAVDPDDVVGAVSRLAGDTGRPTSPRDSEP
jgi:iron complex transport system ATP-binding protein